jgi:hypothetical protein
VGLDFPGEVLQPGEDSGAKVPEPIEELAGDIFAGETYHRGAPDLPPVHDSKLMQLSDEP